jgi:hypothetical protein
MPSLRRGSLPATLLVALLAVAAAVAADLVVNRVALASGVPAFSPPGSTGNVLRLSLLFCSIGAAVFLAIRYLVRWRPALVWRVVAYCAMVASFSPDLRMLGGAWAALPNLPGFPGFGGSGPGGAGGRRGNFSGNVTGNQTGGFGGRGGGGGFAGFNRGQVVAFLLVMHALAAVVLTEALARWGLPRRPAPSA